MLKSNKVHFFNNNLFTMNAKFGLMAKDKITGFSGILTASSSYITGCDQYFVQPKADGANFKEGRWFDEGRIEIIDGENIDPNSVVSDDNGCDIEAPSK